jgi:hypothetical protein
MLSAIAEEMWRSGAFRLHVDELKLFAEYGLDRLHLPPSIVEDVKAHIPTHAVIRSADRSYSFQHERFFHFFLAYGVALHLRDQTSTTLAAVLEARELGPQVITWIVWHSRQLQTPVAASLALLSALLEPSRDGVLRSNVAALMGKFLPHLADQPFTVSSVTFVGDMLSGNTYRKVRLEHCQFWNVDLSGTVFERCEFSQCAFGDTKLDAGTRMSGSRFVDCRFTSLELGHEERGLFVPAEIDKHLEQLEASVAKTKPDGAGRPKPLSISEDAIRAVDRYVRGSLNTCDVAIEDMQDHIGELASSIAKIGITTGVLRAVTRPTSGPKKDLVRFQVDRDLLRRGRVQRTGNEAIDSFWSAVAKKYPAKQESEGKKGAS